MLHVRGKSLKEKLQWLNSPLFKHLLQEEFGDRSFRILDLGCGNHSASDICATFPHCEYFGVDRSRDYNNDERDFSMMQRFWEIDLTSLSFDDIPDDYFDAIKMTHVIEHLYNGDLVLSKILGKLRRGGVIYLEYPRFRSTQLPTMRETLNFFDDDTHCRLYSLPEIYNILLKNNFRPVRGGVRRNWFLILAMPIQLPRMWHKRGYLVGADFWDLLGFAEYVFARKIK